MGPGPGKFDGRSVEDSSSRAVHAFHGPLIYYGGRSNKQITSRPVIRRLVAEMTLAGFQRFPRNHAEYHFLPKRGTMRSLDAIIVPQKKRERYIIIHVEDRISVRNVSVFSTGWISWENSGGLDRAVAATLCLSSISELFFTKNQ